jgi:hypothetical protein
VIEKAEVAAATAGAAAQTVCVDDMLICSTRARDAVAAWLPAPRGQQQGGANDLADLLGRIAEPAREPLFACRCVGDRNHHGDDVHFDAIGLKLFKEKRNSDKAERLLPS